MMQDIYVLDKNLSVAGIVDDYISCIWAKRYNELGDCELYLSATTDYLNLLQKGYYLIREDDDMVCVIRDIELDTDAEKGNHLIITGVDAKALLDQRIVWDTMTADGNLEDFLRQIVSKSIVNAEDVNRRMTKPNGNALVALGTAAGFGEATTEQVSYKNVGAKIREVCKTQNWGYRFVLENGVLCFELYAGADKSNLVVFSDSYENLITTVYKEDNSKIGNVALIAGEGEGASRKKSVIGSVTGTDRFEIFVDAKDIAREITWDQLTAIYPTTASGGEGHIEGDATSGYTYQMNVIDVQLLDLWQLYVLQHQFPDGQVVTVDGVDYYRIEDVDIADLINDQPTGTSPVILRDVIYTVYLLTRGFERLADYGSITSFSGTIEPSTTFVYKTDYDLGDIVKIQTAFGISVNARIMEIVECKDQSGYSVQPKFEYLSTT